MLRLARHLRRYIGLGGNLTPRLTALADDLKDLTPLTEVIQQCISPHNFILDQASPGLAAVRRELTDTRERVNRQIKQEFFQPAFQDALQSPLISQRHGRYVIPIKADHRGAIPGIIHDQSQTKATLYLEPLAIVEHNNALNLLHNREKREEEAVLRRLTDLVRNHLDEIRLTLATLGELDAIQARVRFAEEFRAREPIWRSQGGADFRQARHPLLVQQRRENRAAPDVVPVDLRLTPEHRFLIISGANAGGKTVALKTLGLLTLMAQSGIPIPVDEGSEMCPFGAVFADIGDPQDLSQSLSTFSAHLKRALTMLTNLPESSLILLDELGTATDPTEGGALALALLQAFFKQGAYGAATTHLPILKSFAQKTDGFENVAVIFNEETRRPTYRLAYGVVGASNALKLAREMGLAPEILEMAEGYLNQDELRAYRLLASVEAAQQDLARQEMEIKRREAEVERHQQELEARQTELEAERTRLVNEAKSAALARIKEAEAEFKAIVRRLQRGREPWGKLRQEFSGRQAQLLADLAPEPAPARGAPVFARPAGLPAGPGPDRQGCGRRYPRRPPGGPGPERQSQGQPRGGHPGGGRGRQGHQRRHRLGLPPAAGLAPQPQPGGPAGGRGPAPGGPAHRPGGAPRPGEGGHHPRGGHRPPETRPVGPPETPRPGKGTPRRRQPRGDGGGFEGVGGKGKKAKGGNASPGSP